MSSKTKYYYNFPLNHYNFSLNHYNFSLNLLQLFSQFATIVTFKIERKVVINCEENCNDSEESCND